MSAFRSLAVEVRALGPLLVGGQSAPRHGGDKASARDVMERPVIPASALRGALRIELERLLRGRDGDAAVCGANVDPQNAGAEPCDCPACRLFGQEGHGIGTLRLEDAVLAETGAAVPVLRSQVAVGRRTGSAVSGHLAFLEAAAPGSDAPPIFRARAHLAPRSAGEGAEALDRDLENLRAACAALSALGGGKARGFGWVECSVVAAPEDGPVPGTAEAPTLPSGPALSLRLCFEALAPLHLGDGRPLGGFLPTRTSAPGSTVRGAVAFALLEQGLCTPEDERFQRLVAADGGVSFGTARAAGDRPSATRRKCRPNEHVFDDLVGEFLRREAARREVALLPRADRPCPKSGCTASKVAPWHWQEAEPEPRRRVRTRTAINRRTGTSMDQKLYSVEVLEPVPLVLTAEVRGVPGAAAELLARLHGREVWLGGRRSRGMGRCRLTVEPAPAAGPEAARQAIEDLTREVRAGWGRVQEVAGDRLGTLLSEDEVLVALVLDEPWAPEDEAGLDAGPLAAPEGKGLERLHAFLGLVEEGRFGAVEAKRFGAPETVARGELPPDLAAAPGSTYVYRARRSTLDAELESWLALGRAGSGRNREIGWGRFTVRGPELDDGRRVT